MMQLGVGVPPTHVTVAVTSRIAASPPTSFDSYTFTYKWRIDGLEAQLLSSSKFNSPTFSSPSGATPATNWMLAIFNGDSTQTPPLSVGEQRLSVELKRRTSYKEPLHRSGMVLGWHGVPPGPSVPKDTDVWVEA